MLQWRLSFLKNIIKKKISVSFQCHTACYDLHIHDRKDIIKGILFNIFVLFMTFLQIKFNSEKKQLIVLNANLFQYIFTHLSRKFIWNLSKKYRMTDWNEFIQYYFLKLCSFSMSSLILWQFAANAHHAGTIFVPPKV